MESSIDGKNWLVSEPNRVVPSSSHQGEETLDGDRGSSNQLNAEKYMLQQINSTNSTENNSSVVDFYNYNKRVLADSGGISTWNQVTSSANFPARMNHGAVTVGDSTYIMGGYGGGNTGKDIYQSVDNGATWKEVTVTGTFWGTSVIRQQTVVLNVGTTILLLGGNTNGIHIIYLYYIYIYIYICICIIIVKMYGKALPHVQLGH